MGDPAMLVQNLSRISTALELTETVQQRVIIILTNMASFSKSKNELLKELYLHCYDVDSIQPEINQMLAFGLIKEINTNRKVRLSLARDLWKLKPHTVEAIVKTIKAIANKNHDYDFIKIVKEVKKNLVRYKLIDDAIDNKTLKIITTCSLLKSDDWGFVDNTVIRIQKLDATIQNLLFDNVPLEHEIHSEIRVISNLAVAKVAQKRKIKINIRKPPMPADLTPLLSIAKDILTSHRSGMHVSDIAAKAISTNRNLGLDSEDMAKKLAQVLASNVNNQKPLFARVLNKNGTYKRGVYKLKQVRNVPLHTRIEIPQVDTGYFGKAGEYAVSSELLFWGFNVSLMAVDQGVDLVASKDGRYYHLQVKTSTPQSQLDGSAKYHFTILEKTFLANHNSTMWYVFVLRKKASSDYVVMASSELLRQRNNGLISGKDFSIKISSADKGKHFLMGGKVDINSHINNFALIV